MIMDYIENIIQLGTIFVLLLLCLFGYIESRRKIWLHASIFFLGDMLSSYFWTAYLMIMGADPNTSNALSYLGWNISFAALLILVISNKNKEERRYFNPLMLVPIPVNLLQLILYLPFGGILNSVFQVTVCTATECFSLQGLLWYQKEKKNGAKFPIVQVATFLYPFFEFGMWTSSCFYNWIENLYYPCSLLCILDSFFLVWAIGHTYDGEPAESDIPVDRKFQNIMKTIYVSFALICSFGGILLGIWIRDMLSEGIRNGSGAGVFDIIPVILFLVSMVIAALVLATIMLVYFEQKVAENSRLREARRVAEHSNEAKSDFLASMSHEIRTPINAVLGMNEMILKESIRGRDKPPENEGDLKKIFTDITGYAGNIDSAGNNLLAIINDILDFSKIEAGKMEIRENNYELSSVLNDVSNMIIFRAREKGIEYNVDVEDMLPDGLYGDEIRVRQILTNVLNNAVKYTKQGSVSLSVSAGNNEGYETGKMLDLMFVVRDTGIGIKEEDIGKLFGKFERMDMKQNVAVEGTGLGLAITRRLLELMGGDIKVESVYGKGSAFTITIPQKVVNVDPVGNFREKYKRGIESAEQEKEIFRAKDAHILVVDDTKMNLMVIEGLLRDTGIQIDTALSGREAIGLTESKRYDVILMDQRMPEMDGTEAMRIIREQEKGLNRDTPVISLTADAISGAKERYLAIGFSDYLSKPIDSRELKNKLMEYLPEDKVTCTEEETQEKEEEENAQDTFTLLRKGGIEPEDGMKYSEHDEALYRMILEEYKLSADERKENMERYYAEKDWKNYGIVVHTLKSSSRLIGANALADASSLQEKASNEGNEAVIKSGFDDLLKMFDSVVDAISKAYGL